MEKGSQSVSRVIEFGSVRAGEADCGDTQVLNCPSPTKTSQLAILKQEPPLERSAVRWKISCKFSVPSCKHKSRCALKNKNPLVAAQNNVVRQRSAVLEMEQLQVLSSELQALKWRNVKCCHSDKAVGILMLLLHCPNQERRTDPRYGTKNSFLRWTENYSTVTRFNSLFPTGE